MIATDLHVFYLLEFEEEESGRAVVLITPVAAHMRRQPLEPVPFGADDHASEVRPECRQDKADGPAQREPDGQRHGRDRHAEAKTDSTPVQAVEHDAPLSGERTSTEAFQPSEPAFNRR